jgi:hypothetical protein
MADTTGLGGTAGGASFNLGAIYDLIRGVTGGDMNSANKAAGIADPLSGLNSTTLPMLQKLLTDPSSIKGTPGYQFAVGQGQDAISRAANAQTGSGDPTRTGSLGPALAKFTEGYALQDYNSQIQNLLGTLPSSPAAAAGAYQTGTNNQQGSIAGGLTGIGNILQALGIPQAAWGAIQKALGMGGQGSALNDPTAGLTGTTGDTGGTPDMMLPGDAALPDIPIAGDAGQIPDLTGFDLGFG